MRITFEMSGGYAGLFVARPLRYGVDTNSVTAAAGAELTELVRSSGVLDLDSVETGASLSHLPGVYEYKLLIIDEGRSVSLRLDDTNAPASARPLLQYLQSKAMEERTQGA